MDIFERIHGFKIRSESLMRKISTNPFAIGIKILAVTVLLVTAVTHIVNKMQKA